MLQTVGSGLTVLQSVVVVVVMVVVGMVGVVPLGQLPQSVQSVKSPHPDLWPAWHTESFAFVHKSM